MQHKTELGIFPIAEQQFFENEKSSGSEFEKNKFQAP